MASLIWNPIDYVRFMVHYARLQYSDAVIPAGGDRSYGLREFVGTARKGIGFGMAFMFAALETFGLCAGPCGARHPFGFDLPAGFDGRFPRGPAPFPSPT